MANLSKEVGGDFSKVNRLLDEARLLIDPKITKSHKGLIIITTSFVVVIVNVKQL